MTYPLSDTFSDPRGRWDQFAPWDATEASDSIKGFLATQQHVDFRSFRALANEAWTNSGALAGVSSFVVQKIAARGGWAGLQATTNGAALNTTFISSLTVGIDLSAMTYLSIIFPDYDTFDGTSTVQLTSDPAGIFGNGFDSAAVAFSANAATMPELLLLMSSFAAAGFNATSVTGIKVTLAKAVAPAAGLTITMMAIRGVVSAWSESWLDFDTRIGAICVPVTLTGNLAAGSVAHHFEFVRGDGGHEDPIPADTAINIFFAPGGETSPNDATGTAFNKISTIFREVKNSGAGTGSHIEVSLFFNDTSTKFEARRVDTSGGAPAVTTTYSGTYDVTVGNALDPTKEYVFNVEIKGTQVIAKLYESSFAQVVGNFVWQIPATLSDAAYIYRNGRCGFIADLLTRDAFVNGISVAPTGFASLTTKRYVSRAPVDGAQLATVASPDLNLWDSFTGPDIFIDQTKTLSGHGSARTSKLLTTNSFIMDDWTQSYLDVAIWVPSNISKPSQPVILLNTGTDQKNLPIPTLQPAQWNLLHLDLGIFRNLLTGVAYSFSIQASSSPDRPIGNFWVDSMVIGRRRVAWYVRATTDGQFRPFKNLVNEPHGAVHFNPDERGTQLQLKAIALTDDAWIASYNLFPRYAQLGLPVYDQAFKTR